jgi:DNA polymerase-3 subunit alpha
MDNYNKLRDLVFKGARDKKLAITDVVLDRISDELTFIEKQGFVDLFIMYSRIIEICNELNLIRSFGRGSASNSLVSYYLDITKINPIDENLIFERFVFKEQKWQPDIDIDIPKGHQTQIIENLTIKYPEYNAFFIAFLPQNETNYIDILHNNTIYKKHPSGIILTTEIINNSTFSYNNQNFYLVDDIANDYFYNNKIDFIELEYLNRLQVIINEIGQEYHPYRLPLNDKDVFNFIASGDLENIFQLNATSLNQILSQFKPSSIHDLSIVNAMYRPGLLDYIPNVINNKFNNEERFCSSDKRVSEILNETYGLLIYQETFLHLLKEISGISYAEADLWRRKMIKNKSRTIEKEFRSVFANGCRENSSLFEDEIVSLSNIVTSMLPLSFLKAHSLSYSIISYWGAYYKFYFRTHFDKAFSYDIQFQSFELY